MNDSSRLTLAAAICTYNRYDVLPGAINSLLKQDLSENQIEIIVVDNSPDQEAAGRFARGYESTPVRYLLEPIPGLSNARNVAAKATVSRFIAYIDDDAVAAPDWASNLIAGLRTFSPKVGVAGGRVTPRWISPRPEWLPDELLGNLSIVDWGGQARELGAQEWIAGCNIAFDRELLLALGGFSLALGRTGSSLALLSNEENQLIDAILHAGRSAVYLPGACVEHLIEPSRLTRSWFRRRAAWQAVSDFITNPQKTGQYSAAAAERVRQDLLNGPSELPPGFARPHANAEHLRWETSVAYDLVVALLSGGVEIGAGAHSTWRDKLIAYARRGVQQSKMIRAVVRQLRNLGKREA